MFPQGGPGVALLLLRISVAAILVLSAVNRLSNFSHLLAGAAVLVGVLLVIGLFTPVSSLATVVLSLTNLLIDGHPSNSVIIVVATAILESKASCSTTLIRQSWRAGFAISCSDLGAIRVEPPWTADAWIAALVEAAQLVHLPADADPLAAPYRTGRQR